MKELTDQANVVRYIIRSKDRVNAVAPIASAYQVNGTSDFTLVMNQPVVARVEEFWIKVVNVAISTIPYSISRGVIVNTTYAFDTNAFVDICCSFQQAETVDSENGICEKSRSDQTIAYFSYDSKTAGALTNFNASQNQWIRVRNNNVSFLQFKLFSDTGMQLATRQVTGNSLTAVAGSANTVTTGTGYLNSAGTFQQLVIPFTGTVANVIRGDQVTGGTITNYILGEISVLANSGGNVTIGFPNQSLSAIPTSVTVAFYYNAKGLSPLKDWSLELLVTTTNPLKNRIV